MNGTTLALALVPAAWLLPNHYPPWVSAWQEGLAIALLALAALACRWRGELPRLWLAAGLVALGSIAAQAALGRITFTGDALMAALYIGLFLLAIAVGDAVLRTPAGAAGQAAQDATRTAAPGADSALTLVMLGTVAGATVSVGIALVQWTDISFARLWIADLPPEGRPFSNIAQPNNFSTAAFLGLAALATLREAGRIGSTGFWLGAAFMLLGMVMSGSRMAWVHLAIAVSLCLWFGRRAGMKLRAVQAVALVLLALAVQAAWSPMDDALARKSDRPLDEKLSAGARPALWADAVAAIAREPVWGHGWQQIGAAQQSIALDRPPVAAFIHHVDHAHNIVLDLLLWAGIPVGGLIALLCAAALWRQLRRLRDPRAVWLMAGVLALVAHGMVELPLEFAYFLVPLGVALGMVHAMSTSASAVRLPRWALSASGAALAVMVTVVSVDYLKAEESFRMARLETARIGTDRIVSQAPDLLLLDQLEAFLRFVRNEARPGMTPAELEQMGQVARRFGFAPALFRYALALGLNGKPQEAARTLQLICHIHSRKRCQEAREAWPAAQQRFEALRAVPAP